MMSEIERLHARDDVPSTEMWVSAKVECPDSRLLLDKVSDVLEPIASQGEGTELSPDALPVWFVRSLEGDQDTWSVAEWLGWMSPEERTWWWWDARLVNRGGVLVRLVVDGWPTALGSFEVMMRAAGAISLEWQG